jgi:glycosyltransferase involved in cell wall biosynthesis
MKNFNKSIKFLHISRQGSKNGGAAAFRTHHALMEAGYRSEMILKSSYNNEGRHVKKMLTSMQVNLWRLKKKLKSYLPADPNAFKSDPGYYYFGVDEELQLFETKEILKKLSFTPDVIIFYFIDEFLNYKNVYEIQQATNAKVYLYPMDMGPVTGGCHYTWSCEGYKSSCENCPAVVREADKNRSRLNLEAKKKYVQATDMTVLSPSTWMLDNMKASYLFRDKKVLRLFIPVDSNLFRPRPKTEAKKRFNLDTKKKTIFLGAQYLKDKRKGLYELLKSLQVLSDLITGTKLEGNIQLLIAGREDKSFLSQLPFEYKFIGLIDNIKVLPFAYNAGDIYVCPSLQDAGPMMINESIMSGTPVVSFDMGVAQDLVITGETGYKATLGDPYDFAQGIFSLLSADEENYLKYARECRGIAMQHYSTIGLLARLENIIKKDFETTIKVS